MRAGAWHSSLLVERARKTVLVRHAQCEDQPGPCPSESEKGLDFFSGPCSAPFSFPGLFNILPQTGPSCVHTLSRSNWFDPVNQIRFSTESFSIHLGRIPYSLAMSRHALFWEKPQTVIQGEGILS